MGMHPIGVNLRGMYLMTISQRRAPRGHASHRRVSQSHASHRRVPESCYHAGSAVSTLTSSCPPNFAGDDENTGKYVNLSEMKT